MKTVRNMYIKTSAMLVTSLIGANLFAASQLYPDGSYWTNESPANPFPMDYLWSNVGTLSLNDPANWVMLNESLPTDSVPSASNNIFFNSATAGDVVLTATDDLEVNGFIFSLNSAASNYIFNLGTPEDPKTLRVNGSLVNVSDGLQKNYSGHFYDARANFKLANGTIDVAAGKFNVFGYRRTSGFDEGIQFVVDGPNSILSVANSFIFGNVGHQQQYKLGRNSTILFQNGGQFIGGGTFMIGSGATNVSLRVTGEGSSLKAQNITIGNSGLTYSRCLIESNAVVNCTGTFAIGNIAGGNRLDITNATLTVKEFHIGSGNTQGLTNECHIWKGGQVTITKLHVGAINGAHNSYLYVHPEATLTLPSVDVATYNGDIISNCHFVVEGGLVNCTGNFVLGNGNVSGVGGHGLTLEKGALVDIGGNLTVMGGVDVGDYCSIDDSSLVMSGTGKKFTVGQLGGKRGTRFTTNATLTVSRGSLLCTNTTVSVAGYTPNVHLTDSHVVCSALIFGRHALTGFNQINENTINGIFRMSGVNNVEIGSHFVVTNSSTLAFDLPAAGYEAAPIVVAGASGSYTKTRIDESTTVEINTEDYEGQSGASIALIRSVQGFEGLALSEGEKAFVTNLTVKVNGKTIEDNVLYVKNDSNGDPTLYAKLPSPLGLFIIVR